MDGTSPSLIPLTRHVELRDEHVYGDGMSVIDERIDARVAEIADVAGALNLANAHLVRVMEQVMADEDWVGVGIHSPAQWLSYRAGVTISRARTIIAVADDRGHRLAPATKVATM